MNATSASSILDEEYSSRRGLVKRRVQIVSWVVLTLVWVMLWGNFSWINVLSGVLLSALVLAVFGLPLLALSYIVFRNKEVAP